MKKLLYYTGLGFIALFLFATHSRFLFALDPGKESELFVLFEYDFKKWLPYIFGAAFGIITTVAISLLSRNDKLFWFFILSVTVFEMIGVFLYNNIELANSVWRWFSSIYYAVYTGWIIAAYAYISSANNMHVQAISSNFNAIDSKHKPLSDSELLKLHGQGLQNKEIALRAGVHPSTISRRLKALRND